MKEEVKKLKRVELFKFHDIRTSYLYWRNFMPETLFQEYIAKKRCVGFGKTLLYTELRKCKDETKKARCEKLVEKAKSAMKRSVPARRTILFQEFAGMGYPIYKLSAEDVGDYYALSKNLGNALKNFKNQQYKHIIGMLQEIDRDIYNELVINEIIFSSSHKLGGNKHEDR